MAKTEKTVFEKITISAKKTNDYAFLLGEDNPYEVKEWIDTGCYALNAVLSDGDIFKGIPRGKRVMISGESGVAKSLFTIMILRAFLKRKKNSYVIFFESEGSSLVEMCKDMGIPEDRMITLPVMTVEETRYQAVKILDTIIDEHEGYVTTVNEKGEKKRKKKKDWKGIPEDEKQHFIMCIDSLGMLGTKKETEDIAAGKDTKDMTRAQLIKGLARVLSLKLSIAQVPMIIVNHTYAGMDKYNPEIISGGSGPRYMADVSLVLHKYRDKDEGSKKQTGVRITIHVHKSRYMIENKSVNIILHFKKGLYKFSSLYELARDTGAFVKEGISFKMPDGRKTLMKNVRLKAFEYMSGENLEAIREAIKEDFGFGTGGIEDVDENLELDDEEMSDDLDNETDSDISSEEENT